MIPAHTLYRVFFMKMGGNVRELWCFLVDHQNYLYPLVRLLDENRIFWVFRPCIKFRPYPH